MPELQSYGKELFPYKHVSTLHQGVAPMGRKMPSHYRFSDSNTPITRLNDRKKLQEKEEKSFFEGISILTEEAKKGIQIREVFRSRPRRKRARYEPKPEFMIQYERIKRRKDKKRRRILAKQKEKQEQQRRAMLLLPKSA